MEHNNSDLKKASFWIGQIFIVVATVLGVYLAALQGFKQAVAFDTLQRERNSYYLQSSLKAELLSNIALAKEYTSKVKGGMSTTQAISPLNTFIWEAMKNSPSTLEIPSSILSSSQKFYRRIPELQAAAGTSLGIGVVMKEVEALTTSIESETIPALDKNLNSIKENLKQLDIK